MNIKKLLEIKRGYSPFVLKGKGRLGLEERTKPITTADWEKYLTKARGSKGREMALNKKTI